MRKLEVELTGKTPLLMHSPKAMLEPKEKVRKSTKDYNPKEDAEKAAYRMKNGNLFIPATAIKGCMIGASAWKKAGKFALKPIVAASVFVEPMEVDLKTKKYEVDLQTVVVQRSRIVRARPRLDKWKAKFNIVYNEELINKKIIKEVLDEGGVRVGLLDFRPQKLGSYGTFTVTKIKEVR